jgi:LDH2 family malate/lactate/ureidoglycolate dehydrogenase
VESRASRSVGKGIGHFFGALQIDGSIDKDEFKKQIDEWIRVFRKTKPAPGTNGPLIPGDQKKKSRGDQKQGRIFAAETGGG